VASIQIGDRAARLRGGGGLRHHDQSDDRRGPSTRRWWGIGTALYEETPKRAGLAAVGTLADYLVPCAAELPAIKLVHMHTPTPYTEYGVKGMGEGGAIAPPAAIANAVRDALVSLGAEVNETPLTPRRVLAAIQEAKAKRAS
jgi:carbon-monoxide dehydrogenase large subunit